MHQKNVIEKQNRNYKQQEIPCAGRVYHPCHQSPYLSMEDFCHIKTHHCHQARVQISQKISHYITDDDIHRQILNPESSKLTFQFINPIHKITFSFSVSILLGKTKNISFLPERSLLRYLPRSRSRLQSEIPMMSWKMACRQHLSSFRKH